jgi:hypothetical protein
MLGKEIVNKPTSKKTSIFNDIDAAPKKGSKAAKIKHNNSLREKYGKDANVARAISSKFEAIAEELKAKGIFTKIEC